MNWTLELYLKDIDGTIIPGVNLKNIPGKYIQQICRDKFTPKLTFKGWCLHHNYNVDIRDLGPAYFEIQRDQKLFTILKRYIAIVKVEYGWWEACREFMRLNNYINDIHENTTYDIYFTYT